MFSACVSVHTCWRCTPPPQFFLFFFFCVKDENVWKWGSDREVWGRRQKKKLCISVFTPHHGMSHHSWLFWVTLLDFCHFSAHKNNKKRTKLTNIIAYYNLVHFIYDIYVTAWLWHSDSSLADLKGPFAAQLTTIPVLSVLKKHLNIPQTNKHHLSLWHKTAEMVLPPALFTQVSLTTLLAFFPCIEQSHWASLLITTNQCCEHIITHQKASWCTTIKT